jgi:hypothetical protein
VSQRKNRRQKTKFIFDKILDTMTCQVCGESESSVLDFHHLCQEEKETNVSFLKSKDYGAEKIIQEISKCACLCSNCHRKLHAGVLSEENIQKENIFRLTKTINLAIKQWRKLNEKTIHSPRV